MSDPAKSNTIHKVSSPSFSSFSAAKEAFFAPHFRSPKPLVTRNHFIAALYLRKVVFVDEQRCDAANEFDDADDTQCLHWLLTTLENEEDGEEPAAIVRLAPASVQLHVEGKDKLENDGAERPSAKEQEILDSPDMERSHVWDGKELYVTLGRLATLREYRGRGYGRMLVEAAVEYARQHPEEMVSKQGLDGRWKGLIQAHAQKAVVEFYAKLGFEVDEGMGRFWEEGIEHVGVWRRVRVDE